MTAQAPSNRPEALLTSLAILKVNWDEQRQSYIDNFVPFVADVLRGDTRTELGLLDIQQGVQDTFGILIPQGALNTVVARAARRGLLDRRDRLIVPRPDKLVAFDVSRQRKELLRQHAALIDKLRTFAEDRFDRRYTEEEAEAALQAYVGEWNLAILQAMVGEGGLPMPVSARETEFVVASFIARLLERDPDGFAYLESVVKGSMLAGALYLPDLGRAQKRFDGVVMYFDTPFLLHALGYTGLEGERAARELMELAYELGATLACFDGSVAETEGVLIGAAGALRSRSRYSPQVGGVAEYFMGQGVQPSDVEVLIDRLPKNLKALRVSVHGKPGHVSGLTVDEVKLEEALQNAVHYQNRNALLHDLDALTSVYRLRQGSNQRRLEECRAIFVTTNESLVRASRSFFHTEGTHSAPMAILHHDLATLAWLKKPLAAPDLPTRQIIADCYAAMSPDDPLWNRYLDAVEHLKDSDRVSADEYAILKFSPDARRVLMEQTLGEASVVSETTVQQVLHDAKSAIQAPLLALVHETQKTAAAQVAEAEQARSQTAAEIAEKLEDAKRDRDQAVQEKLAAVKESAKVKAELNRIFEVRREKARRGAARWARVLSVSLIGLPLYLLVIAAAVCYIARSLGWRGLPDKVLAWGAIAFVAFFLIELADYVLGLHLNVRQLVRRVELRIAHSLEARFMKRSGL